MQFFLFKLPTEKNLFFTIVGGNLQLVYHSLHSGTKIVYCNAMDYPDTIQIRSSCCVLYQDRSINTGKRSKSALLNNFRGKKTYSGEVSHSAAKRIARTVGVFVQKSPTRVIFNDVLQKKVRFKLSFLTLTVPDLTDNNASEYYRILLKPFLRYIKNRFGVTDYIWKAEIQSRGSIHYHLTLNQFIPYTFILDKWNELLDANNLMENFKLKYGHNNPNSIDIHSVRNISNIEAYLVKYISKGDKNGYTFRGKVWGCSESLQKAKYYADWLNDKAKENIDTLIDKGGVVLKYLDQCIILKFAKGYNIVDICKSINEAFINWCYDRNPILNL